jgi:hypothetical protein
MSVPAQPGASPVRGMMFPAGFFFIQFLLICTDVPIALARRFLIGKRRSNPSDDF